VGAEGCQVRSLSVFPRLRDDQGRSSEMEPKRQCVTELANNKCNSADSRSYNN
jgi:hypothetical protein